MGIDFSQMVTAAEKSTALAGASRAALKIERDEAVRSIVVETASGRRFDGDEISQGRMARAILGLEAAGEAATVRWVLADNVPAEVDALELREALALAGQAQADLWLLEPVPAAG